MNIIKDLNKKKVENPPRVKKGKGYALTKWDRNAAKLKKFQDKQMALMDKLRAEGYTTNPSNFARMDKTPKRISEKYLDWYKKQYSTARIKKSFYKDIKTEDTRYGNKETLTRVTASQRPETQRKQLARDTVKKFIKDNTYAIKHGYHKADIADAAIRAIKNVEKATGKEILKIKRFDDAKKDLAKTLKSGIDKKAFREALELYDKNEGRFAYILEMSLPYTIAITPNEIYRERHEVQEKARRTFKYRFRKLDDEGNAYVQLTDEDIDKLMDFFETDAWQRYRNAKDGRYQSDDVWALRDELNKQEADPRLFLDIFQSDGDLKSSLSKYHAEIKRRSEEATDK